MSNHFSMRLQPPLRTWLQEQSKKLKRPMTKIIGDVLGFYLNTDVPQKSFMLVVTDGTNVLGTKWEGTFTGTVRLTVIPTDLISAIELHCVEETYESFVNKVNSIFN